MSDLSQSLIDAAEPEWITSEGWQTEHFRRGDEHPPTEPAARWTECGRLVMRPLSWRPEGLRQCGQCLRRRAAASERTSP